LKILVHDYPGHPFPVQLTRELARRGHHARHQFFGAFQAPKGALARRPDDPPGFEVECLELGESFAKYSFLKRRAQERRLGALASRHLRDFRPDLLLAGNAPLDIQAALQAEARRLGIPFVFWLQDLYSIAIDRIMRRKLPVLGALIGRHYIGLERRLLRHSDAVIAITEDFRPTLRAWGVQDARVVIEPNWAPLDEIPARPRANDWSAEHDLVGRRVLLYAGTMGLKHNPALIADLAQTFAGEADIRVVVVSEGLGAQWLTDEKARRGLDNLTVLPFQPYARVPDMLASADVLVSILEPDAGAFSVPSKVLAYLCAGRPVLAAIPADNQAARLIGDGGLGLVADPGDTAGFVAAARRLMDDATLRAEMGARARAHAERAFDIGAIGERFEKILVGTLAARATTVGR
jgi:glycosyltransferase involved in cell wall biosynthesis